MIKPFLALGLWLIVFRRKGSMAEWDESQALDSLLGFLD